MAPGQAFGFAGAAAVLMLVQVQALALDRRFGFAGAAAVLMLVQAPALDRRFVLRHGMTSCHAQNEAMSCQGDIRSRQGWHQVIPGMTSCHALNDIMSCQGWHHVIAVSL